MPKTESIEITKKLIKIYEGMEEKNMTPVQQEIRNALNLLIDDSSLREHSKTDYFKKRIDKIVASFAKKEDVIQAGKGIKMPKPNWNITKYGEEEKIKFYKLFIELNMEINDDNKQANRKAKYNINKKIDVENDYSFVIEMLKKLDEKNVYPDLNQKEEAEETVDLTMTRKNIVDNAKKRNIDYIKKYIPKDILEDTLIKLTPDVEKTGEKCLHYLLGLIAGWYNKWEDMKNLQASGKKKFEAQKNYYVLWNLWIYIIMQTFQYFYFYNMIKNSSIDNIIRQYEEMGKNIEEVQADKTDNLISGYYRYNSMLKIRTGLVEEIQLKNIKQDRYVELQDKDLFSEETCQVQNSSYTKTELCRMFHSGETPCKIETFNKRIKECEKFIEIYTKNSPRSICAEDYRHLRAVYRTRYVNDTVYKRKKLKKMMDDIMEFPDRRDENLLKEHYVVGMAISKEIMNEKRGGMEMNKAVDVYMSAAYKLALLVLYRDYPYEDMDKIEFTLLISKLEKIMQETWMVLYKEVI